MAKKLFVRGLSEEMTNDRLQDLFSEVGSVESVAVIIDRFTGHSKGFGFVEMSSEEEASKAKEKFNGFEIDGKTMFVDDARPQENRNNMPRNNYQDRNNSRRGNDFNRRRY